MLAPKTVADALCRLALLMLGIGADGKKEIVELCLAVSESPAEWERFNRGGPSATARGDLSGPWLRLTPGKRYLNHFAGSLCSLQQVLDQLMQTGSVPSPCGPRPLTQPRTASLP